MSGALPYYPIAEIAVVTLPEGHVVMISIGDNIISKSAPFDDFGAATAAAKQAADRAGAATH